MIKGGFYIKARCIQDSEIAKAAPHIREIWDWILKEANHKDTNICKRGECVRTFKDIQEGLSWYAGWRKMTYSKDQCEKAMKWLRKATMIATKKTTRGMVISILNYDKFQTVTNYESNNESHRKATDQQQSSDTINKNDKNDKNEKNIITSEPSSQIKQVMDVFYKINPTINWGNKTQREAITFLINKLGFEKTLNSAIAAVTAQGKKYAPVITTPYQLKEKLSQLVIFYQNQKQGSHIDLDNL